MKGCCVGQWRRWWTSAEARFSRWDVIFRRGDCSEIDFVDFARNPSFVPKRGLLKVWKIGHCCVFIAINYCDYDTRIPVFSRRVSTFASRPWHHIISYMRVSQLSSGVICILLNTDWIARQINQFFFLEHLRFIAICALMFLFEKCLTKQIKSRRSCNTFKNTCTRVERFFEK